MLKQDTATAVIVTVESRTAITTRRAEGYKQGKSQALEIKKGWRSSPSPTHPGDAEFVSGFWAGVMGGFLG